MYIWTASQLLQLTTIYYPNKHCSDYNCQLTSSQADSYFDIVIRASPPPIQLGTVIYLLLDFVYMGQSTILLVFSYVVG